MRSRRGIELPEEEVDRISSVFISAVLIHLVPLQQRAEVM